LSIDPLGLAASEKKRAGYKTGKVSEEELQFILEVAR
jgi:hypothetical protein